MAVEAGTELPELLEQVAHGKTITLTVGGQPVAQLRPVPNAADAVAAMRDIPLLRSASDAAVASWIREGRA